MLFIIIGAVILLALLVLLIVYSWRLVRQSQAIVVERLGKFHRVLKQGIHFVIPIIDREVPVRSELNDLWKDNKDWADMRPAYNENTYRISLKERVADFPPQDVITKDNAVVKINTVVFFQVTDPKQFVYGAEDPIYAIQMLTETTVRNIVGELELDGVLSSRDLINKKLCYTLDEAADAWGIKIMRVEVQEITPPEDVQKAMHAQMKAERNRRAMILTAEGEKRSAILVAEGRSQATILEGSSKAEAIRLINGANPSAAYLTLEGYKAVKDLADGNATKIVVPSDIQNIAGLFASLKSVVSEDTGALKVKASAEEVVEEKKLTRLEILAAKNKEELTEEEWLELELAREEKEKQDAQANN